MLQHATKSDLYELETGLKSEISELKNDIKDVLKAINSFAQATEQRFQKVDQRFVKIESQMVTKSYLDEKLCDLRGDIVSIMSRTIIKHENRFHAA